MLNRLDVLLLKIPCSSSPRPWVGLQFVIVVFPDHTHLFLWTNQSPKRGLQYQTNSFNLTVVLCNLSDLAFVQNKDYQYSA